MFLRPQLLRGRSDVRFVSGVPMNGNSRPIRSVFVPDESLRHRSSCRVFVGTRLGNILRT